MAVLDGPALAEAAAEVKAYLRIVGSDEDALLERLTASGAALCEAFTGRWLITRPGAEVIAAGPRWRRLSAAPVRAILGVDALPATGEPAPLAAGDYAIDIDADGCGWVRTPGQSGRARVRFEAGLAASWAEAPEGLRQGVVRLAAHLYTHRSRTEDAGPPAAVSAMWRPWRRIGIGGAGHVPGV